MQTRTLYTLIAAGLLALAGAVAATETHVAASAQEAPPASSPPEVKVGPAEVRLAPGGTATLAVHARAASDEPLALAVEAPQGFRAALSAETLAPGGRVALTVHAPADAAPGAYVLFVRAEDEAGASARTRAVVHVVAHEERQPPAPGSARPWHGSDERLAQMERRLAALEERVARLEGRLPDAPPREALPVTMQLLPQEATVPPEGGRVALLLEGNGQAGHVRLALRLPEESGWRGALEDAEVFVPPHGRAWTWIRLAPLAPDAPPLRYAVVDLDTQDAARGSATSRTA